MTQQRLDRREFALRLALGTTALPIAAATFSDGDAAVAAPPATVPDPANADAAVERAARDEARESDRRQTDLLLDVVKTRYADPRLTTEVLANIREDIDADVHRGRSMSAWPLANSDEPAPVFAAWRRDPLT